MTKAYLVVNSEDGTVWGAAETPYSETSPVGLGETPIEALKDVLKTKDLFRVRLGFYYLILSFCMVLSFLVGIEINAFSLFLGYSVIIAGLLIENAS